MHGARLVVQPFGGQRLLAELADGPAAMLGCSLGAVIGLHLAPRLLPPADRVRHEHELAGIQRLYRREGPGPALKVIAEVLGIDPARPDAEPDLLPQPMTPGRVADFGFFIEYDFTAVIDDVLPVSELTGAATRIVPAVGRTTPRTVFDHRCAERLAVLLGTELVEFPGGHNGNTTHPRAYAARLLDVLDASSAAPLPRVGAFGGG